MVKSLFGWARSRLVRLVFPAGTVFFSHNKPARTVFFSMNSTLLYFDWSIAFVLCHGIAILISLVSLACANDLGYSSLPFLRKSIYWHNDIIYSLVFEFYFRHPNYIIRACLVHQILLMILYGKWLSERRESVDKNFLVHFSESLYGINIESLFLGVKNGLANLP